MLADYVSAGFAPETFWRCTLREIAAHMRGAGIRLKREHSERAWLAHTTAALSGVSGKHFPKLQDLIDPPGQKVMTADEMQAVAMRWHAAVNNRKGR